VGPPVEIPDAGAVDAENPWPGLSAFREADRDFFQGRETETDALHRLILRERLTVLFGLSGLGKTSLLQAGVFPRLREDNVLPVYIRLDYTPGHLPFTRQIQEAIARAAAAAEIEAPRARGGETLWELFHRQGADFWNARNRIVVPLLIFDQFEELFTLGKDRDGGGVELLDELADLIEGRPPAAVRERLDAAPEQAREFSFNRHDYKVLFSLREDFLPDLEGLRERIRSIVHNRLRLTRMNGRDALTVVTVPGGALIEPEVAERVIRFVAAEKETAAGGPLTPLGELEVEPALLSVVCRELNNQRRRRGEARITADLLAGSRTEILSGLYERNVADLPAAVRAFVEDQLLTVSGYRDSVAWENALSVPGVTAAALATLIDRRLLRSEHRGGVQRIELTHDLLTGVIRESRDRRQQRETAARAEAAQRAAEEKARRARRRLLRARVTAALLGVLLLLALAGMVWGYRARRVADRAFAAADLEQALNLVGKGRRDFALAHLARAARLDPESQEVRNTILQQLLRRTWPIPLARLTHQKEVLAARWSPAGRRVVTASKDGTARVWDVETGHGIGKPMRHEGEVVSAEWSPDGRSIATASKDHTARLWDARTGLPAGPPLRHEGELVSARWSPAGGRLLTVTAEGTARLWDIRSGSAPSQRVLGERVEGAAWSPDGGHLGTFFSDSAQVWDGATGQPSSLPLRHGDRIHSVAWSPDGRLLVTASSDRTARIWDAATGLPVGEPMRHADAVLSAAWGPDGRLVVTAGNDRTVRLWEARSGRPVGQPMVHQRSVTLARWSPGGERVITISADQTARLWDAATCMQVGEPLRDDDWLNDARFSPDGRRVITASDAGTARVWAAPLGGLIGSYVRHRSPVNQAVFSPDSQHLATASDDGTARLWEAQTGFELGAPMVHGVPVLAVAWSPAGDRVATAAQDGAARIWDGLTGRPLGEPLRHGGRLSDVGWSPDGSRLVTAGEDGTARLWDLASGRAVSVLRHAGPVSRVRFSPGGGRVATASRDGTARIWDAATGGAAGPPLRHRGGVNSVDWSPDGERVVTASDDSTAQVWKVTPGPAFGTPVGPPLEHQDRLSSARFNRYGTWVVTASFDGTARVWDAATGVPLNQRLRHQDSVVAASFPSTNTRVLTASWDGTGQVWIIRTGRPLGEPMQHQGRVLDAEFSPDGQLAVTASEDGTARIWHTLTSSPVDAPLLAALAEAIGGIEIDSQGLPNPVPDREERLAALRRRSASTTGVTPAVGRFIGWLLADPWRRAITPFSGITATEYIKRRLAEGTAEARQQAESIYPGHPLLHPPGAPLPPGRSAEPANR
jgi:WD40 repeat protein